MCLNSFIDIYVFKKCRVSTSSNFVLEQVITKGGMLHALQLIGNSDLNSLGIGITVI